MFLIIIGKLWWELDQILCVVPVCSVNKKYSFVFRSDKDENVVML